MSRTKSSLKHLRDKYGLTPEGLEAMEDHANDACQICSEVPFFKRGKNAGKDAPLHVDHDHILLKVRGLLCFNCNLALGGFRDKPERLLAALLYLKRYEEEGPSYLGPFQDVEDLQEVIAYAGGVLLKLQAAKAAARRA